MKQNLGRLDRILRFALAFWWLGPWTPALPFVWANWVIFVIGAIALLESFTGSCWLHTLFRINNKAQ